MSAREQGQSGKRERVTKEIEVKRDICKKRLSRRGADLKLEASSFFIAHRLSRLAYCRLVHHSEVFQIIKKNYCNIDHKGSHDLVSIHGHSLGVAAEFPIGCRADRSASGLTSSSSAALLQCQQLLRAESFVMNLTGCLNKVLQMRAGEEIAQVDEFAVILVFDVNHTPAVLAAANLLSANNDGVLATDNSKWDNVLHIISANYSWVGSGRIDLVP